MIERRRCPAVGSLALAPCLALLASAASSQELPEIFPQQPASLGEGWQGFADLGFLLNAVLTLTLAAVLGAVLAYHPRRRQAADTLEELEAPKAQILYAVIGAIIGILVVKYGLIVGFVLFGIGGLIRFRTILGTAAKTGQVMYVTLIGLSCGLDLPHVAVLATAFGFVLIFILETHVTFRMDIRALPAEHVADAAAAYREQLQKLGCSILSERKNPTKERVTFIFRAEGADARERLERAFAANIDIVHRGTVDWDVD